MAMSRLRRAAGLTLIPIVVLASSGAALAADETPKAIDIINKAAKEDGVFKFDWGVPSSPSLKLLGQAEDKVPVVNGLKPLLLKIPSLVGGKRDGDSWGLDIAPAAFLGDRSERTYNAYVEGDWAYRVLVRTHVGGALYEGVDDTDVKKRKRSRATLGLSTSLLDQSDPLKARLPGGAEPAWKACLERNGEVVQAELNKLSAADNGQRGRLETEFQELVYQRETSKKKVSELAARLQATPDDAEIVTAIKAETDRLDRIKVRIQEISDQAGALTAEATKAKQTEFAKSKAAKVLPECAKEANLAARYGQSLAVGAGTLWNGDYGGVDHFKSGGTVAWLSYRRPVSLGMVHDDKGELKPKSYWFVGGSLRASWDEGVSTGITARPEAEADTFDGWLGVERMDDRSRLALQAGWQRRSVAGGLVGFDRERFRYFVAYSRRITDEKTGLWVQLGYGHAGSGDTEDKAVTLRLVYAPPDPTNIFGTK